MSENGICFSIQCAIFILGDIRALFAIFLDIFLKIPLCCIRTTIFTNGDTGALFRTILHTYPKMVFCCILYAIFMKGPEYFMQLFSPIHKNGILLHMCCNFLERWYQSNFSKKFAHIPKNGFFFVTYVM